MSGIDRFELKHAQGVRELLAADLRNPRRRFVAFVLGEVHPGRRTRKAVEEFTPIVRKACREFVTEQVDGRLRKALDPGAGNPRKRPERS